MTDFHRCDHDEIALEPNVWWRGPDDKLSPPHALQFTSGLQTNSVLLTDRDLQRLVDELHAKGWRPSGKEGTP